MAKALDGNYKATVSSVNFGAIGKKDTPAIEVGFRVSAELIGSDYRENANLGSCKKAYWLSAKIISGGQNAGKTSVEVTREQLKDSFEYTGGLDQEELQQIVGKEVYIKCEPDDNGYTDVRFVNATPGPKRKKLKELSANAMATIQGLWSGKAAPAAAPVDAKSFFKKLKKGKDEPAEEEA